jgi:hypothetical protein
VGEPSGEQQLQDGIASGFVNSALDSEQQLSSQECFVSSMN